MDFQTVQILSTNQTAKQNRLGMDNYQEVVGDGFSDISWTDETTVQLESHRRHSFRQKGEPATLKPRPKNPVKLHGLLFINPWHACAARVTVLGL